MRHGYIQHNKSNGVLILAGDFTMHDGSIAFNTDIYDGAGVKLSNGTFTMEGGSIAANNAPKGAGVHLSGATPTFNMRGGEITNNHASGEGGGVFVDGGTINMSGGNINQNTSKSSGGGVYFLHGVFNMTGGEIYDNTAAVAGGGLMMYGNTDFTKGPNAVIRGDGAANQNYVREGGSASGTIKPNCGHAVFLRSMLEQSTMSRYVDSNMSINNTWTHNYSGGTHNFGGTWQTANWPPP